MTSARRALAVALATGLLASLLVGAVDAPPVGAAGATVTPDRPLIDGETVTVRGSGLPVGHAAGTIQCTLPTPTVLNEVLDRCDIAISRNGTVNQHGAVQFRVPARRFMKVQGQPVDCAQPEVCAIAIHTLPDLGAIGDPYSAAVGVPIVFDPGSGQQPLDLEVSIDEWDSRSVTATVRCSEPVSVRLGARLEQARARGSAVVSDARKIECDTTATVTVLLMPRHDGLRPFLRLRPGGAELTVSATGRAGRWRDTAKDQRSVTIHDTGLATQQEAHAPGGARISVVGLRVTRNGGGLVRARLDCARNTFARVQATVLSDAAGGAYRAASSEPGRRVRCDAAAPVDVDLPLAPVLVGGGDRRSMHRLADIVPTGRAEVHLRADSVPTGTHSQVMRPVTVSRQIRPETLRVHHRPTAPLRIGDASTADVRGSVDCDRTGIETIHASAGQQVGQVVIQSSGATTVRCVSGRTAVFDIDWQRPIRADQHTRIGLFVPAAGATGPTGPFLHTQGGWRRTTP